MKTSQLHAAFESAAAPSTTEATPFRYGWCKTDHKDGKEIRWGFRTADYMKDEPYAAQVRSLLKQLGLPFPKPEEIFRGTNHDLLFLDSHGVVVRIGPTNVEDLLNPAILQPLGWLESKTTQAKLTRSITTPLTVAVYPGIEQFRRSPTIRGETIPSTGINDLYNALSATGQKAIDVVDDNSGYIRVLDEQNREIAVSVLLDSDNSFNGSSEELAQKRTEALSAAAKRSANKADVLLLALRKAFEDKPDLRYRQLAFEAHQPLRRLFWAAFGSPKPETGRKRARPDRAARAAFWEACARVTNNPQSVMVPLWHATTDKKGRKVFQRKETCIPHVVLYRPWTGAEADRTVPPIKVDAALKKALGPAV
ncbi:MAG: hypothetical protein KGQ70_07565 [Alphaproteobacteria bacterium]|nr:hypothetical protein [Alphaproteobacteria bacterium]